VFFVGLRCLELATMPIAVQFELGYIDRQCALRHWTLTDLRTHARISKTTGANLRAGRRVDAGTLAKVAAAFDAHPPDPVLAKMAAEGLR
jgi:DNA-binding Xre family transcriptional regulator